MPIRYDNPPEVGADRIVNAVAAHERTARRVVVVDFGTATTFDVVNARRRSTSAASSPRHRTSPPRRCSRTPRASTASTSGGPTALIGRNTVGAMQSGIYFGYVGLVDGILARLERGVPDLRRVVATGGLAELIAAGSEHITRVEPLLTLTASSSFHERNR